MTLDAATIGARVAAARARAGKTQADVARESDLDRSALAKIESGVRRVSALELARIAEALRERVEWFLVEAPPSVVAHRNASFEAGPGAIDAVVEAAARDVEFVVAHDDSWTWPELPVVRPPDSHKAAEALALEVRSLLDLGVEPARDLVELAGRLGLVTFSLTLGPGAPDGASVQLRDGGVAVVNGDLQTGRRRLTLAHELGHYLSDDEFVVDWWRDDVDEGVSREATLDWFARALLLPEGGLRAFVGECREGGDDLRTTAVRAASHFRVDMSTLARRLVDLGILGWEQAHVVRAVRTTKADIIELNLVVHDELAPPTLSRFFEQSVLRLYRADIISDVRAVDLLRGVLDEEGLPELPLLPESAIWTFV